MMNKHNGKTTAKTARKSTHKNHAKQPLWKQQGWGRGWDRDLTYVSFLAGIHG